jgi:hypothetical protein
MKKDNCFTKEIDIAGAKTSVRELTQETIINFAWGFFGNSIVVFMSKEIDIAVFVNFILYYMLISYIVNREKYKTRLGKFIVLPVSAAAGAFVGYKMAQYISNFI